MDIITETKRAMDYDGIDRDSRGRFVTNQTKEDYYSKIFGDRPNCKLWQRMATESMMTLMGLIPEEEYRAFVFGLTQDLTFMDIYNRAEARITETKGMTA